MSRIIRKIEPLIPKIPSKKRVAANARVSSGKDSMLYSLSAQISYYNDYIQKHCEWEYVGVYIPSKELIRYINNVSKIKYTDQTFKTNIIACLRDSGVIISSSANGYKIPVSKIELYSYTNITLGMVMPMLERLSKCRDRILSVTDNELDILDVDEYKKIKRYFDEMNNNL